MDLHVTDFVVLDGDHETTRRQQRQQQVVVSPVGVVATVMLCELSAKLLVPKEVQVFAVTDMIL